METLLPIFWCYFLFDEKIRLRAAQAVYRTAWEIPNRPSL
jgi:hypothetical protein